MMSLNRETWIALAMNAGLFGGSFLFVRSRLRHWQHHAQLLAAAITALSVMVVAMVTLSYRNQMTQVPLVIVSGIVFALGAISSFLPSRSRGLSIQETKVPIAHQPLLLQVAACIGLTLAGWLMIQRLVRGICFPVEAISDAPIYHLTFALRWWKAGFIEFVPTPFGESAAAYFPANGSLWFAWLIIGAENEALAKVGQWPFVLLQAIAMYGIARLFVKDRLAAIWPAILFSTTFACVAFAGVANVDLIFSALLLIAFFFLLRWKITAPTEPDSQWNFAFFGLASGLALGTKSIGLVFVPLLIVPAIAFALFRPNRFRHLIVLASCLLATGMFWYVRNYKITGNPVYPLQVQLFGVNLFDGWYTKEAMRQSAYHCPPEDWGWLADNFSILIDMRLLAFWVAGIIAAFVSVFFVRRPGTRFFPLLPVAFGVIQLTLFWYFIPYNTQIRFLLPSLALLVVPFALLLERARWLQVLTAIALAWCVFSPRWLWTLNSGVHTDLPRLLTMVSFSNEPKSTVMIFLVAPIVIAAASWLAIRRPALRWPALFVALFASMFWESKIVQHFPEGSSLHFYPMPNQGNPQDFVGRMFRGWENLEEASKKTPGNVAYVGTNVPYYLFGAQLQNVPRYVSPNRDGDGPPHLFHFRSLHSGGVALSNNPYPQWDRADPDYKSWVESLRKANIEYVFIARENLHGRLDLPPAGTLPPIPFEYKWAIDHPDTFEFLGPNYPADHPDPWTWVFRLRKSPK